MQIDIINVDQQVFHFGLIIKSYVANSSLIVNIFYIFYQLFRYIKRQTNILLSDVFHKWEFLRISVMGNIYVSILFPYEPSSQRHHQSVWHKQVGQIQLLAWNVFISLYKAYQNICLQQNYHTVYLKKKPNRVHKMTVLGTTIQSIPYNWSHLKMCCGVIRSVKDSSSHI